MLLLLSGQKKTYQKAVCLPKNTLLYMLFHLLKLFLKRLHGGLHTVGARHKEILDLTATWYTLPTPIRIEDPTQNSLFLTGSCSPPSFFFVPTLPILFERQQMSSNAPPYVYRYRWVCVYVHYIASSRNKETKTNVPISQNKKKMGTKQVIPIFSPLMDLIFKHLDYYLVIKTNWSSGLMNGKGTNKFIINPTMN